MVVPCVLLHLLAELRRRSKRAKGGKARIGKYRDITLCRMSRQRQRHLPNATGVEDSGSKPPSVTWLGRSQEGPACKIGPRRGLFIGPTQNLSKTGVVPNTMGQYYRRRSAKTSGSLPSLLTRVLCLTAWLITLSKGWTEIHKQHSSTMGGGAATIFCGTLTLTTATTCSATRPSVDPP